MTIRIAAGQSSGSHTGRLAASCRSCCAALCIVLAGCEAPLDLSGIEAESARPFHRYDLFQAVARHADRVLVVGGMGAVVHSTDGGGSWQRTNLPGKPFLLDVAACPDGGFHAVEQTDGLWSMQPDGAWARQALPDMIEPMALTCDPSGTLWVIGGYSTILHSLDRGASWDRWSLDEDLYLTTIQFIDRDHGVATGEFGTVLLTADGGSTWDRASDLPDSFYPQAAYFASPDAGWVVGLNGTIWATVDGAQTWESMPTGTNAPLYGIAGLGDRLLATGENATVLYHRVGDASWNALEDFTDARGYLRGAVGVGDGRFVVAGGGGALIEVTLPGVGKPAQRTVELLP